ncbi:response regulator [Candidatus Palauibacter sp.]
MDLAMPGMDGVQATRRITELGLGAKVLVVTIHDEDEFLVPALKAGAAGFLNKSAADTELIGALEAISHGHSYLPQHAAALLARRETQGASNRETGREMSLSPKTVEGYLARAKAKLGFHTRREIVRFALEAGLLRTEDER